jgi:hypothetical protein
VADTPDDVPAASVMKEAGLIADGLKSAINSNVDKSADDGFIPIGFIEIGLIPIGLKGNRFQPERSCLCTEK